MNPIQNGINGIENSSVLIDALHYGGLTFGLIILSYIFLIATSGFIVRFTLSYADITVENESNQRDTGTAIGKVENILVLSLMLLEAYTALGVIFAAKSIVRKDDIDTGDTSYYLTGTIANFTYSVSIGIVVHVGIWFIIHNKICFVCG